MSWDIDVPNFYYKKPKQVAELEELSLKQREAMDFVEIEERVRDAADSLAKEYKTNSSDGDFEGCVLIVNTALKEIGGSLGGKMGARMVGISEQAAREASLRYYPE